MHYGFGFWVSSLEFWVVNVAPDRELKTQNRLVSGTPAPPKK
jgi:hypothetical protein